MKSSIRMHQIRTRIKLESLYNFLNVFKGEAKTKYTIEDESTEDLFTTRNYFKYTLKCGMLKIEYVIAHGERIPYYELSDKGIEFLDMLEKIYNMLMVI